MVNIWEGGSTVANPFGSRKVIAVVFKRLLAFKKTSWRMPPAAAMVGLIPLKVMGLVEESIRVIVATAK